MNEPEDASGLLAALGLDPGALAARRADLLADVREYLVLLAREEERAREVLNVLSGNGPRLGAQLPKARPDRTYDMLRAYIATLGPGEYVSARPAYEWMIANGWVPEARNPLGAVYAAIGNLAKPRWGELRRVERGRYVPTGRPDEEGNDA